jgi:hypothetical protein
MVTNREEHLMQTFPLADGTTYIQNLDKHFSNTMEYHYHISQFNWNKDTNTFYAEAPHLECIMPDGNIHPEAFPNQKGQFFIDNTKTGGFRRFRFRKELIGGIGNEVFTEWIFESEDEIECRIAIN